MNNTILITASNLSPVGINTVLSLRKYRKLVCVDVVPKNQTSVTYFCKKYYKVPFAKEEKKYINRLLNICKKEKVKIILPLTIEESVVLQKNRELFSKKRVYIANSHPLETILICLDKWLTNEFLEEREVPVPLATPVTSIHEIHEVIKKFDYPKKRVVIKPRVTHGSRGFKIITPFKKDLQLITELKPTDYHFIELDYLCRILAGKKISSVLMEYLSGDDYSVYAFCLHGEPLIILPMKRLGLIPGMSTGGILENNKVIIDYVKTISRAFNFNGSVNLQMKYTSTGPKLYEVNTRLSATTVITRGVGVNFPLCEILLAENRIEELRHHITKIKIQWGLRMNRIHQEIYRKNNLFILK